MKLSITTLCLMTSFQALAGLPGDYYNPVDTNTPASHVKCVGSFYEHNKENQPYHSELSEKLLIPFEDSDAPVNFSINGKQLNVHIFASQVIDYKSFNSSDISNVDAAHMNIYTSVVGTNISSVSEIDLTYNDGILVQQFNGSDHLYIECYLVNIVK